MPFNHRSKDISFVVECMDSTKNNFCQNFGDEYYVTGSSRDYLAVIISYYTSTNVIFHPNGRRIFVCDVSFGIYPIRSERLSELFQLILLLVGTSVREYLIFTPEVFISTLNQTDWFSLCEDEIAFALSDGRIYVFCKYVFVQFFPV